MYCSKLDCFEWNYKEPSLGLHHKSSFQVTAVHSCNTVEDATAHLHNSVHRYICNEICKEAPLNMCICTEYGHAFINTYITTCRYCQYAVHADSMSYGKGFANFPEL